MPVPFGEIGARAEDIPLLAEKVAYGPDETTGNAFPLDRKQVEEVFKLALEG